MIPIVILLWVMGVSWWCAEVSVRNSDGVSVSDFVAFRACPATDGQPQLGGAVGVQRGPSISQGLPGDPAADPGQVGVVIGVAGFLIMVAAAVTRSSRLGDPRRRALLPRGDHLQTAPIGGWLPRIRVRRLGGMQGSTDGWGVIDVDRVTAVRRPGRG